MASQTVNPIVRQRSEIEQTLKAAGIHRGMWARSATVSLSKSGERAEVAADGGFEWILTTEKPTVVWDWERWDFVEEILLADGMLVPAIGQVSLLDCHSRSSVKDVLGHVKGFAEADAGGFPARSGKVFFAADQSSLDARAKVEGGHITDGSVGYQPKSSIWIDAGAEAIIKGRMFKGPVRVTYEWLLKEFSITPIGADVLAKVRMLCGA